MNKCKFGNVKKINDGNIIAKNINVNSIFFGEPHAPTDENKAKHIIQKIGHAERSPRPLSSIHTHTLLKKCFQSHDSTHSMRTRPQMMM